ncbi:MAG: archaemetzincin family Zn-dependent metalloprotease [Candidatus Kryptoniota bacterium]
MAIQISTVGSVNEEMTQMVARHVKEMFGCEVKIYTQLPQPDYAFDEKRSQYSSTVILRNIAPLAPHSEKFLAITEVDLFIPMMTFVYGQAQLSGKMAIVSLARLKPEFYGLPPDKDLTVRRIRKEVSHELGHTFGLVHCAERSCLMSLSTEIFQVDLKSENFCKNCWIILEENLKKIAPEAHQPRAEKNEIQPEAGGPTAQKRNELLEIRK